MREWFVRRFHDRVDGVDVTLQVVLVGGHVITQVAGEALALMHRLCMHSEIIHKLVCRGMYYTKYRGSEEEGWLLG